MLFSCFFFFKQKTAYEMRISDWSSDVCSSDLAGLFQWKLHIAVLLSTFALFPVLGVGISHFLSGALPSPLMVGVVLLCLMPSTVQSSIAFTSIAGGNVAAALCAASLSNFLGVFISPLLAGWLLQASGVALSFDIFRDLVLQFLVRKSVV